MAKIVLSFFVGNDLNDLAGQALVEVSELPGIDPINGGELILATSQIIDADHEAISNILSGPIVGAFLVVSMRGVNISGTFRDGSQMYPTFRACPNPDFAG